MPVAPLDLSLAERAAFDAALDQLLQPTPPSAVAEMARGHFATGGKRLRARLALAAARAQGVPLARALPWALACEVLHNATLVHDDLQDGDTTRRGAPTVWVRHGMAQAINVGDWLFMRALAAVDEAEALAAGERLALQGALRRALETVIDGQARECSFRGGPVVDAAAYSQMVHNKTAALFSLPVWGAALLCGHPPAACAEQATAFEPLGELFQWIDDIVDVYGDKQRQAPAQDLYEGKMSALVVTHVARVPADAAFLQALLEAPREQTRPEDVARARRAFDAADTLQAALAHAANLRARSRARCPDSLRPTQEALFDAIFALVPAHLCLPASEAAHAE